MGLRDGTEGSNLGVGIWRRGGSDPPQVSRLRWVGGWTGTPRAQISRSEIARNQISCEAETFLYPGRLCGVQKFRVLPGALSQSQINVAQIFMGEPIRGQDPSRRFERLAGGVQIPPAGLQYSEIVIGFRKFRKILDHLTEQNDRVIPTPEFGQQHATQKSQLSVLRVGAQGLVDPGQRPRTLARAVNLEGFCVGNGGLSGRDALRVGCGQDEGGRNHSGDERDPQKDLGRGNSNGEKPIDPGFSR